MATRTRCEDIHQRVTKDALQDSRDMAPDGLGVVKDFRAHEHLHNGCMTPIMVDRTELGVEENGQVYLFDSHHAWLFPRFRELSMRSSRGDARISRCDAK